MPSVHCPPSSGQQSLVRFSNPTLSIQLENPIKKFKLILIPEQQAQDICDMFVKGGGKSLRLKMFNFLLKGWPLRSNRHVTENFIFTTLDLRWFSHADACDSNAVLSIRFPIGKKPQFLPKVPSLLIYTLDKVIFKPKVAIYLKIKVTNMRNFHHKSNNALK